ncbi:VOC family protein [Streptomyces sp. NPDC093707]|uniref:VOC family protein n=1 Tax=Streptomyces sp. NPDC093707 TaxID=3154984 RepID=UPI00344D9DE6
MASRVRHVTFDSSDAYRLGQFWAAVLDGSVDGDASPGDPEVLVNTPGSNLLFIAVPDAKTVKNRVHVDLQPQDRSRDEEVARVLDLGATVVGDHRNPDGTGWVTLADPEGNEFCVERSAAERAQTS